MANRLIVAYDKLNSGQMECLGAIDGSHKYFQLHFSLFEVDPRIQPDLYRVVCLTFRPGFISKEYVKQEVGNKIRNIKIDFNDIILYDIGKDITSFHDAGKQVEEFNKEIKEVIAKPIYPISIFRSYKVARRMWLNRIIKNNENYKFLKQLLETDIPIKIEVVPEAQELFSTAFEQDEDCKKDGSITKVVWSKVDKKMTEVYDHFILNNFTELLNHPVYAEYRTQPKKAPAG